MGDEDRSRELPQRARGAARPGPGSSTPPAAPVLSEEVWQRVRTAVEAERAQATRRDQKQATEPPPRMTASGAADSDVASRPAVKGISGHGKRAVKTERGVKADSAVRADLVAKTDRAVSAEPAGRAEPVVKPQPAGNVPANHKLAAARQTGASRSVRPKASVGKEPRRWRLVSIALVLILIVAGSLAAMLARHSASPNSSADSRAGALQRQELVARAQAATWVIQQVDHRDTVSCDRVMCTALAGRGFPSRNLLVLGPTSHLPVTSTVVVATAAVRYLFGTSIDSAWAPAVLASFGSGDADITIRVMAPHGALAYQAAANLDLKARMSSETALLNDNRIMASTAAKKELAAGQVDSRFVPAIASLATGQPIDIVDFGNIGPGASAGIPLRFADLAVSDQAAHMISSAYVRAMRASLNTANIPYHPDIAEVVVLPSGQNVFRVEFLAPSPFGVLSSQGSS